MYKFEKEMPISAKECFDALIDIAILEVERKTGKVITRDEVMKGYKYPSKRKVGRNIIDAKVHIKKPEPDHRFHTSYSFDNRTIEMDYLITALDDTHMKLVYTQDNGNEEIKGLQKFLMNRDMKKKCKGIAKYVLSKKN